MRVPQRYAARITLLLVSTAIVLVIVEHIGRQFHSIRHATDLGSTIAYDSELGWKAAPNVYTPRLPAEDHLGNEYVLVIQTDERGSRLWGTSPGAKRVFFIGDSFTHARQVSSAKAYYSVFSRLTDYDVYAYGAGGYGSLQELLVLKRYFDEITPEYVVIQFCTNDFVNNSYESEGHSVVVQQKIRPYLVDGEITYRYGPYHPVTLGLANSKIFGKLTRVFQDHQYERYGGYMSEEFLENYYPAGFQRDVETTSEIFGQIREYVAGRAEVFAFNCRGESEQEGKWQREDRAFRAIIDKHGMSLIDHVAQNAADLETSTMTIRASDGAHLNEYGHELWAEQLASYFEAYEQNVSDSP